MSALEKKRSSKKYFKNLKNSTQLKIGEYTSRYRLLKLEPRTQSLENFQQSATTDISLIELEQSLNFSQTKYKTSLDDFTKQRENLEEKIDELKRQNSQLDNKTSDLGTNKLYLEAYSRRENIKFEHISEDDTDDEDTEQKLRDFVETNLGFRDAQNVEIKRVYRLGRKKLLFLRTTKRFSSSDQRALQN